MENCFKKQLNAILVDDGSMRKENELRFNVSQVANPTYVANGTQYLEIQSAGNVVYCIGSDGSFVNASGQDTGTIYPETGTAMGIVVLVKNTGGWQVGVKNKYTLTQIKAGDALSLNVEELEYCTDLVRINAKNAYGDIYYLRNLPLSNTVEIQGGGLFGDIKYLPSTAVNVYMSSNPNIVGDISSLGKCTSLIVLRLNYCEGIYGSLENLAAAQVTNGRTSGELYPQVVDTKVTYQGQKLSNHKTIKFGSSMTNPSTEETAQGWQIV